MLSKPLLSKLMQNLRKFCNIPDGTICRVHIIAFGDLFQLPPIANTYIFENPDNSCNSKGVPDLDPADVHGRRIWKSFETVVMLTENIRQEQDESFSKLLRRLRYGKLSRYDLHKLNSRVISARNMVRREYEKIMNESPDSFIPIAVNNNNEWHLVSCGNFIREIE